MAKKQKFKVLDVVATKFGTVTVVAEVSDRGDVSIALPATSRQKVAWYKPEELHRIGTLAEIVALAGKTPTKEDLKTIVPEKFEGLRIYPPTHDLERVLDLFADR
jgi:hypothetical protein